MKPLTERRASRQGPNTSSAYRISEAAYAALLACRQVPIITSEGHVVHGKVMELYALARAIGFPAEDVYSAAARDPRILAVCDEAHAIMLCLPEALPCNSSK